MFQLSTSFHTIIFVVLSNQNVSIAAPSLSDNTLDTSNNMTVTKPGVATNIPVVVQMPQAHISSRPNQDSQNLGLTTNSITTVSLPSSDVNKVALQNSETTQQQQLIAAAMASLSTSIPNASVMPQQAPPHNNSGNKSISASIARSIYQGKLN